jgi:hypothetical protein
MDRGNAFYDEIGAGVSVGEVLDHPRGAIAKRLLDPFYPEIAGLVDVRIS